MVRSIKLVVHLYLCNLLIDCINSILKQLIQFVSIKLFFKKKRKIVCVAHSYRNILFTTIEMNKFNLDKLHSNKFRLKSHLDKTKIINL